MVRKLISILLTGFFCLAAAAQSRVTGKVVDAASGNPEPGVLVRIFEGTSTEGESLAYGVSDTDGNYEVKLAKKTDGKEHTALFEIFPRLSVKKSFILTDVRTDLGQTGMEDDVQILASSEVTAAKPLVKMDVDKISYDVTADAEAKATTVLEMLRKVPMVTVDGEDNITVNGSSSFKVYVDGKPNQMMSANPSKIFKAMPAAAVKNIEVITNPGAKYDAEGTGGVLNLVIAKTEDGKSAVPDGISGSVNAGVDSRGSLNGGLYLNAKKGKFSFGTNLYAGLQNRDGAYMKNVQEITESGLEIISESDIEKQSSDYLFGNINANYEPDTLNLFSATIGLSGWSYTQNGNSFAQGLTGGAPVYSYGGISLSDGGSNGIDASLDWQHNFSRDKFFTLSYRYSGDPDKTNSESRFDEMDGISMVDRKVNSDHYVREHTVQADYTAPLGPGQTLSTGLKYIFRNVHSEDIFSLDQGGGYTRQDTPNSEYTHLNHIASAYGEYAASLGIVSFKAGLRYEYTWLDVSFADGDSYGGHYDNLVPNLSLQMNTGLTSNIGFTYNMRIRRPGVHYLNPFIDRSSPTEISYGNPDTQPEKTHSLDLKYNYFSPKIMVSAKLGYRFGEGGIASYRKYGPDPEDASVSILQSTYGNIISTHTLGVNVFANWNPVKDTRIYASTDLGHSWYRSDVLGQDNKGLSGNFVLGGQQTVFWDLRLGANLFGSLRSYSLQGWNSGFNGLSLSVTKNFLEDRLGITLHGFTNLTGGKKARFRNYSEGDGFVSDGRFAVPIRSVGISLSYNFGKTQVNVKKVRNTINNDDLMSESRNDSTGGAGQTSNNQIMQ